MASGGRGRPRGPGRAPPPIEMDVLGEKLQDPDDGERVEAAGPFGHGAELLADPGHASSLRFIDEDIEGLSQYSWFQGQIGPERNLVGDNTANPWDEDELEEVISEETTSLLGSQPKEDIGASKPQLRSRDTVFSLLETKPLSVSGTESVAAIIAMLKELLLQERISSRSYCSRWDSIFRMLIEVMEGLESMTVKSSTSGVPNLNLQRKRDMMKNQLVKLTPIERNYMYCIMFVLQSNLHKAAATRWQPEDGPFIHQQIEEVTKTLGYFLYFMSIDIKPILILQRVIGNTIWEMNNLYKVKHIDDQLPNRLDNLTLDLMQLANSLLSSIIQWLFLGKSFSLPEILAPQETPTGDRISVTSTLGEREISMVEQDYMPIWQNYVHGFQGLRVLEMVLTEVLSEVQRSDMSTAAQTGSMDNVCPKECIQGDGIHTDNMAGGDGEISKPTSTILEEQEAAAEVIEVMQEAIDMTRDLLKVRAFRNEDGRLTDVEFCRKKIHMFPKEVKADSMLLTQYLDVEKFKVSGTEDSISGINSLVSLNNVLVYLRWSIEQVGYWFRDEGEPQHGDKPLIPRFGAFSMDDNHSIFPDLIVISKSRAKRTRTSGDGENISLDHGILNKFKHKFQSMGKHKEHSEGINDYETWRCGDLQPGKVAEVSQDMSESRLDFWTKNLKDKSAFEDRLRNAYGKGMLSPSGRALEIDRLLFEREKAALQALSSKNQDLLENLDKVAYSWKGKDSRYWTRLPQTLRSFPRPPARGPIDPLEESIMSIKKTNLPRKKLRAKNFQLFALGIYPILYVFDIGTDLNVARGYLFNSNYLYFTLTILFILGPMVAEMISKVALKLYGTEKSLSWKKVLNLESIRLLPRSLKSFKCAWNSRKEFDSDLQTFYVELNRLRGQKGGFLEPAGGSKPKFNTLLIPSHFYAMTITNDKHLFNWKMADCLNESAPQLLLQLVIMIVKCIDGEEIEIANLLGIISSLASLSWTMHLCHYYMHYDGLKNNFQMVDRITDFLAHFLIVGARFLALSFVAALHPKSFFLICIFYLPGRCIYLIYFSSISWAYKLITKNRTTFLWPFHRLYITPYILRLWRCDAGDDIIYYLETFILALSWPYLVAKDHPMGHLRWIVPGIILGTNFILLPALLKFNDSRHEPSRLCRVDNFSWLGKHGPEGIIEREKEREKERDRILGFEGGGV